MVLQRLVPAGSDLTKLHVMEAIVDGRLDDQLHLVQFFWWDLKLGRPVDVLKISGQGKIKNLGGTGRSALC